MELEEGAAQTSRSGFTEDRGFGDFRRSGRQQTTRRSNTATEETRVIVHQKRGHVRLTGDFGTRNLPVTINNFVQSPYAYWKELAWSGALLITFTVLALNIGARILGAERAAK